MEPGEDIVLVICCSEHRDNAFEACRFLMDFLKTHAPFWKLKKAKVKQNGWMRATVMTLRQSAGQIMRWRSVAMQWVTVIVLLGVLVAIQWFKPEWTGIVLGPSREHQLTTPLMVTPSRQEILKSGCYGIDAPEYRQTCRELSGKQQACGKLARDVLSKLIRTRTINCSIIERDRYGRQVSVCKDGPLEINREMVRLGWAIAYRRHALNYVAAEREAKVAKRGIWAWRFEMPEDYRNKNRAVEGNMAGD